MHFTVTILLIWISFCNALEIKTENTINDRHDSDFGEKIEEISMGKFATKSRLPKFLTFNNDASNIRVEAVFAVPVLAIPIGGKSLSPQGTHTTLPKVDINLKSIISMAGIFLLLFFVIPKLVQIYLPQKLSSSIAQNPDYQQLNMISEKIDKALSMFDIDMDSCAPKAVCWLMEKSSGSKSGVAYNIQKLIEILSNFEYMNSLIEDTWLGSLVQITSQFKNYGQETCQEYNKQCSITQWDLSNAALRMAKYLYRYHQKS